MKGHAVYPKYIDSGVYWFEKIPSSWDVKPLKFVSTCNDEALPEDTDPQKEIAYVEISDVNESDGISGYEIMSFENSPSRARRLVREGDALVSTVRTYLRAIASIVNPPENLIVSTGFAVIRPKLICGPFLGYLLRSNGFIGEVISLSVGVSYPAINSSVLTGIKVPIPSSKEQLSISSFLDRETSKLDLLMREQKELIALLQEKRQALISNAVTKGLNPKAKMKDSGVEWLGDVPEHWSIKPFRLAAFYQEGPGIMASDFLDEGIPLLRISCLSTPIASLDGCNFLDPAKVAEKWSHFKVKVGDLLISGSASTDLVVEVDELAAGSIPYTGIIIIRPIGNISCKDYLRWYFSSGLFKTQVELNKTGSTIQHFGPTHLSTMIIALPPLNEQKSVSKFLSSQCQKIDALILEAEDTINLMQEHRASLISEAVTGKIDVRHLA